MSNPTEYTTHRDRVEKTPASGIDPRGPRFAAALTSLALAGVLLLPTPTSAIVLAMLTGVFAIGAARGVQATPQAWLFRTVVRPRLAPPSDWEEPEAPRFAQTVGLAFTGFGLLALVAGATVVGQVAIGAALVAALLNAVFGFCLGCELYVVVRPLTRRTA